LVSYTNTPMTTTQESEIVEVKALSCDNKVMKTSFEKLIGINTFSSSKQETSLIKNEEKNICKQKVIQSLS